MKRMTVAVLLVWALLSSVAWAGDCQNEHGTVSISDAGIATTGSELVDYNKFGAPKGHSLGSVIFWTGVLVNGSVQSGGTFSATGSSLTVIGNGDYGVPKGVIFSGSFEGPVTWTLVSQTHSKLVFVLAGHVIGINRKGRKVGANTTQTIVTTKGQLAQGVGHIMYGVLVPDT
ncbi:MAG: hypothetical protein ABSG70_03510 [Terriglobales bacterium]|jgi:hypothetical protein